MIGTAVENTASAFESDKVGKDEEGREGERVFYNPRGRGNEVREFY